MKLNKKLHTAHERTHWILFNKYKKKIKENKKGIQENILAVMIKEFYENSIYIGNLCGAKNNDQNKNTSPQKTSHYSFLDYRKSKPMTMKFSEFQLFSIKCFVKN